MEQSDVAPPMSTGNVRNLAKLFETGLQQHKTSNLMRLKSKSSSSIAMKTSLDIYQDLCDDTATNNLSFKDIHTKFESGYVLRKSVSVKRMDTKSMECLKLQEIKEISEKTNEINSRIKQSSKLGSSFYIACLNEIVELLLKIGQIETYGNSTIQMEKLSTLQILQKCYSQLREKLEVFLVDDNDELEEEKVSIRASIEKWETMMENKSDNAGQALLIKNNFYVSNGFPEDVKSKNPEPKSSDNIVEVVKSTDVKNDEKILENIKVKNLKNIWEGKTRNEVENMTELKRDDDTVQEWEETTEEETFLAKGDEKELSQNFEINTDIPEDNFYIKSAQNEEQLVDLSEDTTSVVAQKNDIETFIVEEKKSSSQDLEEPEPKETNKLLVEFLPEENNSSSQDLEESEPKETNKLLVEFLPEENKSSSQDLEDSEPKETNKILVEFLPETTDETSEKPSGLTIEETEQRLVDVDIIQNSTDGAVLSKESQLISVTVEFLNEERKSSQQIPNENDEFLVGDIDVGFRPPTGIIPSLNPDENPTNVEVVEEEVPDNQFLVIIDKPDENGNEIPNDTSLLLVGEDNVTESVELSPKVPEDSYQQERKDNPPSMVNGDKDVGTK